MNKKQNKFFSVKKIIVYFILILILILIFDYFNTFYFLSKNLNFSFLNIIVNMIVVVCMFLVTYILIEKRRFDAEYEKNKNEINVLILLILRTYQNCFDNVKLLDNQEMLEKYFIPKCDFNAAKDEFLDNYKKFPFDCEERIIDLMQTGILNIEYLNSFFEIKDLYIKYVDMRVTFFDIDKYDNPKHKELSKLIKMDREVLYNKLNKQISLLNKKRGIVQ